MDFTYIAAVIIAALVGIVVQIVLMALKRTDRFGLGAAFGLASIINFAALINWRSVATTPAGGLILDVLLLPTCSFIGVIVGVLPLLILVGVSQKLLRLGKHLD